MADLLSSSNSKPSSDIKITSEEALPFGLSPEDLLFLIKEAQQWAAAHGLLVASDNYAFQHAPFSLFPTKFPRVEFDKGISLSKLFCQLVDCISRDSDWLYSTLESVLHEDEFTRKLVILSKEINREGVKQHAQLGIFRSDYMLHEPCNPENVPVCPQLQQVELNTIASSFGCLSSLVGQMQNYLLERFEEKIDRSKFEVVVPKDKELNSNLVQSSSMQEIPGAIAKAHDHYGNKNAIIVFIVQPNEANSMDQKWIEYNLWTKHRISCLRLTLKEVSCVAGLYGDNRVLRIHNKDVSVVYFRAGYTPADYPSLEEWEGRKIIERSFAIKCPSINYHLAGTKKVQQVLSSPGELERFLPLESCMALRECFTGLYGLNKDALETKKIISIAKAKPNGFVLKPQREGGGNNYYGEDIKEVLETMPPEMLESYILMSRIEPRSFPAVLIRDGKVIISKKCISELGLYATCLFDNGTEIFNQYSGHLLRTKMANTDEGGVASGFAVLSNPYLVE